MCRMSIFGNLARGCEYLLHILAQPDALKGRQAFLLRGAF